MCVIWVDDCLFFCKDKQQINDSIKELSKHMPLTKEDSVIAFLGIKIERNNSSYTLSQPGLIQKIIEAVDMVDCHSAKTPAASVPISTDPDGMSHNEIWEYRTLVGMLMFLANNTRPDIAYATHQCARFSHSPKASHSLAIKRIVRYLKLSCTFRFSLPVSNYRKFRFRIGSTRKYAAIETMTTISSGF